VDLCYLLSAICYLLSAICYLLPAFADNMLDIVFSGAPDNASSGELANIFFFPGIDAGKMRDIIECNRWHPGSWDCLRSVRCFFDFSDFGIRFIVSLINPALSTVSNVDRPQNHVNIEDTVGHYLSNAIMQAGYSPSTCVF